MYDTMEPSDPSTLAALGHDFDDDEDYYRHVSCRIARLAAKDDDDKMVNLVQGRLLYGMNIPDDLLLTLVEFDAVNCTEALLLEEGGLKFDVKVRMSRGTFPLHHAAANYSLSMIHLLIHHGASAYVESNGVNLINNGLLPLNAALENLLFHHYLINWTSQDSIFKLITILCLPQMKVPLAAIRLLAQHTKETKEELYLYAEDGHPIQMAVLLMVARDIVLGPFPSQSDDGSNLDGIMSIRKCIEKEIASLDAEEVTMNRKGRPSKRKRMLKDKKAGLHSALLLLHVFEKAGDAIGKYLQTKPSDLLSKDKVVEDVRSILVKAGFDLKEEDTNLSNVKWQTYDGWSSDASNDFTTTAAIGSQPLGNPLPPQSLQGNVSGKIDTCEQKWAARSFFPDWTPTLSSKIGVLQPHCTFPMLKTWYENPKPMGPLPSSMHTKATMPVRPRKQLFPSRLTLSKHYTTIAFTLMKGVKRL